MSERHDDVVDLVVRAEKARTGRRQKVLQEWHGSVSAHAAKAQHLAAALRDAGRRKGSRWLIVDLANGDNWVSFRAVYTAKGANANDAEKLVRGLAAGEVFEVAVDTARVTPVGGEL